MDNKVTYSQAIAPQGELLTEQEITETFHKGLSDRFMRQKVLALIPDHTRSLPLPFLFRTIVKSLSDAKQLDFMVATGTHPSLSDENLNHLVGNTAEERATTYKRVGLTNHCWDDPSILATIGMMESDEIRAIAGEYWHPSLPDRVEIRLNRAALEYDHILILGPTFPHEIVGFSGGAKYLFPGISGPEMIHTTHWLGALAGVVRTIGYKKTPVRSMIHAAARRLRTPITLAALVVVPCHDGESHLGSSTGAHCPSGPVRPTNSGPPRRDGLLGEQALAGVFIGDLFEAWNAAADLSAQRHIRWVDRPFWRVLSCAPPMYDELWTAAKAMYKLEPAVAAGGEIIIYAPHLSVVSQAHGKHIAEIGYHSLPYFLQNWKRFEHIPLGVLAHSTHLRGAGRVENGVEKPNIAVTLASKIPAEDCARLNLGYLDPASVNAEEWKGREDEGILYVPRAGELLYRVKN